MRLYDVATGTLVGCPVTGRNSGVSGVVFHPEKSNILVSSFHDKTIKMWDITAGS